MDKIDCGSVVDGDFVLSEFYNNPRLIPRRQNSIAQSHCACEKMYLTGLMFKQYNDWQKSI